MLYSIGIHPLLVGVPLVLHGMKALGRLTVLLILVSFSLVSVKPAWALASLIITPNPVSPGVSIQVSGTGFLPNVPVLFVTLHSGSSCLSSPTADQQTSTDPSGNLVPVTFSTSGLTAGTYCIDTPGPGGAAQASLDVFTVVEVPYSICVIQLGVQQPNGTVSSLPGYGYPDIRISECRNMTEVLGQDVLGRTIVFHQFILNGTSFVIVTT